MLRDDSPIYQLLGAAKVAVGAVRKLGVAAAGGCCSNCGRQVAVAVPGIVRAHLCVECSRRAADATASILAGAAEKGLQAIARAFFSKRL